MPGTGRSWTRSTLSNGHLALLVDLARHGDLRFDCLLSAELARVYKPAAQVYETAARLLGVEPGEVMLGRRARRTSRRRARPGC